MRADPRPRLRKAATTLWTIGGVLGGDSQALLTAIEDEAAVPGPLPGAVALDVIPVGRVRVRDAMTAEFFVIGVDGDARLHHRPQRDRPRAVGAR